jgi:hypothetical protein
MADVTIEHRSRILAQIASLIGSEATETLVREFGGGYLYIPSPARLRPGHRIAVAIGEAAAIRLCEYHGGLQINLPNGAPARIARRNAEIRRRAAEGLSARRLAREYSVSTRHIERILAQEENAGDHCEPQQRRAIIKTGGA